MNTQINVRLPQKMLISAKSYANVHGYASIQEFIKETIREKLFEKPQLSNKEQLLIKQLINVSEKKGLYGTEKQLFEKLKNP